MEHTRHKLAHDSGIRMLAVWSGTRLNSDRYPLLLSRRAVHLVVSLSFDWPDPLARAQTYYRSPSISIAHVSLVCVPPLMNCCPLWSEPEQWPKQQKHPNTQKDQKLLVVIPTGARAPIPIVSNQTVECEAFILKLVHQQVTTTDINTNSH